MLVLTRQIDEDVCIGPDIRVRIVSVHGGQVRLGIDAPPEVAISRGELLDAVRQENEAAVRANGASLRGLKHAARLAARTPEAATQTPQGKVYTADPSRASSEAPRPPITGQ